MEIFVLSSVVQSTAIALGMGASTLAIINFFVAINDGTIDAGERKMMGVVYVVLRVAMVIIFVTTLSLFFFPNPLLGSGFTALMLAQLTLIAVLFGNALLMTKRIMPSKIGPALQASTWYTFGIMMALLPLMLKPLTFTQFLIGYGVMIVVAIGVVNGIMIYLKKKK